MGLLKIIGIAIITSIAVVVVKQVKSEFAIIVGLAGSVIILTMIIGELSQVMTQVNSIVSKTSINTNLFKSILKIVGIGYLTEFAANICSEIGSQSISSKVIFAGKVVILCLALPIVSSLIDIVVGILP